MKKQETRLRNLLREMDAVSAACHPLAGEPYRSGAQQPMHMRLTHARGIIMDMAFPDMLPAPFL